VRPCTCYLKYALRAAVVSDSRTSSIFLQTLGIASMSVVTKCVTTKNKASQDEHSTHELGLSFRHHLNQTGVAVHMLLPTAVGAVKSSGSGRMPLQSLAISYLFHIVVFECQGAPDPTVWKERFSTHGIILAVGWCMRCSGGGTNLRRRSVIRQPCQTSQQLDQGRFDKKKDTRCPTSHSRSRRAARDHAF